MGGGVSINDSNVITAITSASVVSKNGLDLVISNDLTHDEDKNNQWLLPENNEANYFASLLVMAEYERMKLLGLQLSASCVSMLQIEEVDDKNCLSNIDEIAGNNDSNTGPDGPFKNPIADSTDNDDRKIKSDDLLIYERLKKLYCIGISEWNLPLGESFNPRVIIQKYQKLSLTEKKDYHDLVVKKITNQEKCGRKKVKKTEDFSNSFSGTAEDSRVEREAALLLRSADVLVEEENDEIILRKPHIEKNEDKLLLRQAGVWKRFLGSECYMYIHVLSKEIVSIRPEEYEEDETILVSFIKESLYL
jgi:hypothetical protein